MDTRARVFDFGANCAEGGAARYVLALIRDAIKMIDPNCQGEAELRSKTSPRLVLGSGLIKATIPGLRRDTQKRDSCVRACRIALRCV